MLAIDDPPADPMATLLDGRSLAAAIEQRLLAVITAGLPLAAVIQQAQRLRQSIWILYVDLATFFPRIDREALTVAEVLIGLPPEVIDLVGLDVFKGVHEAGEDC